MEASGDSLLMKRMHKPPDCPGRSPEAGTSAQPDSRQPGLDEAGTAAGWTLELRVQSAWPALSCSVFLTQEDKAAIRFWHRKSNHQRSGGESVTLSGW